MKQLIVLLSFILLKVILCESKIYAQVKSKLKENYIERSDSSKSDVKENDTTIYYPDNNPDHNSV
jgi:hypothetical protein